MPNIARVFVIGGILGVSQAAHALTDVPSNGLLYNTREAHSLTFKCEQSQAGALECDFVQVAVRMKAKPEELEKRLQEARSDYRKSGADIQPSDCSLYRQLIAAVEGKAVAPKPDALNKMPPIQKRRTLELLQALVRTCDKPTEENYLQVIRIGHQKEVNTCLVSSNTWRQTFHRPDVTASAPTVWVVQTRPQGVCGFVDLSRFEPEPQKDLKGLTFWKFISRKAITNPNASQLGVQCKNFDESEYVWDWRRQQTLISCEFVEFSVL